MRNGWRFGSVLAVLGTVGWIGCSTAQNDAADETSATQAKGTSSERATAKIRPEVLARLENGDEVDVIVHLASVAPAGKSPLAREKRVAAVRAVVDGALARSPRLSVRRRFDNVASFSTTVDREALAELADDDSVVGIGLDFPTQGDLLQAVPAIGATRVQKMLGYIGTDVPVAVLDSGVDKTIADLAGRVVAEHCFTQGTCAPGATQEGTSALDVAGHGTNVAAVVASQGAFVGKGFAPGAKIVAVRVLDDHGKGFASDWMAGLDWVLTNIDTQPVKIVNMSLGSAQLFDANCDSSAPDIAELVGQLVAAGVTVFASSGNEGSESSMQLPACLTGVVSVGATYDTNVGREPDSGDYHAMFAELPACFDTTTSRDTVTCFTDSNATLDLVAPGAPMISALPGGAIGVFWGTSESCPAAAGVAALMLEANPSLTPASIESILKETGKPVVDPKNGLTFPRIDALAAVRRAICLDKADGETCDDGDGCSGTDTCQSGVCTGSAPVADGTACSDGNACSLGDHCNGGVCGATSNQSCPPSSACLFILGCDIEAGDCLGVDFNDGGTCDDGDACTTGDQCGGGACSGKTKSCEPPDECHTVGACAAGGCPDSVAVDDGTECSIGTCVEGVCTAPTDDGPDPEKPKKKQPPSDDDGGCGCEVAPLADHGMAGVVPLLVAAASRRRVGRRKNVIRR